ncbi:hypothetical protein [Streptomyces sp. NPDC048603]|uniref:hypothetical protein n=1 Tax=Streptomyces sp. NPDC048603 TaxID=3365577 RepID=UPI00371D5FE7
MLHEIEGVEAEAARVAGRPEAAAGTPVLARFEVEPDGPAGEFAARVREVLGAVYGIAAEADFDSDDELPVDTLPAWFTGVCRGGAGTEDFAAAGRDRFTAAYDGCVPWEVQGWLARFDPEEEARGWAFWDLTHSPEVPGRLRLWVDSRGEPMFSWEELRFLLYTAGARSVQHPSVLDTGAWEAEESV